MTASILQNIYGLSYACRKNKRPFGGTNKVKQINNAVLPTLLIAVLPLTKQAVTFCHFEGREGRIYLCNYSRTDSYNWQKRQHDESHLP